MIQKKSGGQKSGRVHHSRIFLLCLWAFMGLFVGVVVGVVSMVVYYLYLLILWLWYGTYLRRTPSMMINDKHVLWGSLMFQ
jgi:uncharacterized RDD family membrane protein YckC